MRLSYSALPNYDNSFSTTAGVLKLSHLIYRRAFDITKKP